MKKMKNLIRAVFSFLLFFGVSGNLSFAEEPYSLGVALSISGTGSLYCGDGLDAIRLAVEEINGAGGFLGKHMIELHVKDTRAKPDAARAAVNELISAGKVKTVLGTYSSSCAMAIKPICMKYKVLHIAAISNSEDITKVNFSPYTYQVVPNSYMQAKAAVMGIAWLAKTKKWTKYATIASDYEWGKSSQENTVEFLKKTAPEIKLIAQYWPKLGETNFKPYIQKIYKKKPDFLIGSIAGKDNKIWIRQAQKVGLFKKIPYPGSLISVSELITQAKTLDRGMAGLCRAPFFAHMNVPMMEQFVNKFREKHNRYPSDWAVMEYDAVHALRQGIEKAGSIDSEKVKDALKGSEVETCRGRLYFREIDNQLSCSSYVGIVTDDPAYPFPIYRDLVEIRGPHSWRPEAEILEARKTD